MVFKKVISAELVWEYLSQTISYKLNYDGRVLWLVGGGSAIPAAVNASKAIRGTDANLYISLTDERPGAVGHQNSNWQQLKEAGLVYTDREFYQILQSQSVERETANYDAWLEQMFERTNYRIGLFGIGEDGHTAGILPGDSLESSLPNAGYWNDGERQRISITPDGIAKLDEAVVYLTGEAKRPLIDLLRTTQDSKVFPAEYLKRAGKLTVYNDWVEGEA